MFLRVFTQRYRRLAACLAGCFLLAIAAAVASPLQQPQPANWVCSAIGTRVINGLPDDDGPPVPSPRWQHQSAQCVLCLPLEAVVLERVTLRLPHAVVQASFATDLADSVSARLQWATQTPRAPPVLT